MTDLLAWISSKHVTLKISFSKKMMFQGLLKCWKVKMIKTNIHKANWSQVFRLINVYISVSNKAIFV